MSEFPDHVIESEIRAALDRHEIGLAVSLLHVLAVQAPVKAQRWLDVIELASNTNQEGTPK